MANLLTRKLELFGALPEDDRRFLDKIVGTATKRVAHEDLVQEGDIPEFVHLIVEGFACRYKLLEDGRRHIMAYLIPGDFCDAHIFILKTMDHAICTLAPSRVARIPRQDILEMMSRPALARAMWWATLVDEATLREWLVNLGLREATQRVAHLICEIHLRMKSVGLVDGHSFSLPITQVELADTMGITPVHMNRALQALRERKLITFKSKHLVILEPEKMYAFSGFDPNYLHLGGGKRKFGVSNGFEPAQ